MSIAVFGEMMERDPSTSLARDLMMEFADLTGLSSAGKAPRRYLWTDAFAVCNFLDLYRRTRDENCKHLALRLVDQVHAVLGRHRGDDSRTGWISGLDEREGRLHPTLGGLRIGKQMNERRSADRFDERLEWERDGQYYHYLTKWMHALNCASRFTGDAVYNRWAVELAKAIHARFTYAPPYGGRKRMYWKMSIDLSYPLVESMGHHDPLDGFITYSQLQATANQNAERAAGLDLTAEIDEMAGICEGKDWTTDDPLGFGELLCGAFKVAQLMVSESFAYPDLLENLLAASLAGLGSYAHRNPLKQPASYRLAFRELGLSIGLAGVAGLRDLVEKNPDLAKKQGRLQGQLEALLRYSSIGERIESFWLEDANREVESWTEHREINMVMLATSLAPDGYLTL
jgi:hypothetical protein